MLTYGLKSERSVVELRLCETAVDSVAVDYRVVGTNYRLK